MIFGFMLNGIMLLKSNCSHIVHRFCYFLFMGYMELLSSSFGQPSFPSWGLFLTLLGHPMYSQKDGMTCPLFHGTDQSMFQK